ncbi:hypothetical protein CHS0354_018960 [Potamilus streckersoni]|uniref:Uncharacterized protein n=1 Tax=Potamilus streckersoni TaxID=2493646 RepID=A0AAE0T7I5_9BIVA|nr:hypothetical protein CHS0354_018960 [Potamilus streckersoni]
MEYLPDGTDTQLTRGSVETYVSTSIDNIHKMQKKLGLKNIYIVKPISPIQKISRDVTYSITFALFQESKDIDDDYDYIMAKAVKSYKLHREREQADTKGRDFRPGSRGIRRYLRPKTAPPNSRSMKITKLKPVYVPRVDAINEVKMANETEER